MFRGSRQVFQVGQAPSGPDRNSTTAHPTSAFTSHPASDVASMIAGLHMAIILNDLPRYPPDVMYTPVTDTHWSVPLLDRRYAVISYIIISAARRK